MCTKLLSDILSRSKVIQVFHLSMYMDHPVYSFICMRFSKKQNSTSSQFAQFVQTLLPFTFTFYPVGKWWAQLSSLICAITAATVHSSVWKFLEPKYKLYLLIFSGKFENLDHIDGAESKEHGKNGVHIFLANTSSVETNGGVVDIDGREVHMTVTGTLTMTPPFVFPFKDYSTLLMDYYLWATELASGWFMLECSGHSWYGILPEWCLVM